MENKLLLHCCCAPCAGGCVGHPVLDEMELVPELLYFSNCNLDSAEEFERRLACVRELGEKFNIPVEVDTYDHEAWKQAVAGLESESEGGARCRKCFEFSLSRAAAAAERNGFKFATSLTVSPRKSSSTIFDVASGLTGFVPLDFKKKNGYLNGTKLAKELGFYRQNYCGCEFSKGHLSSEEITPPPIKAPVES